MFLTIFQYIFFSAGLSNFANYIFRETKEAKLSFFEFPVPRKPIIAFIGFLAYSSFCNLVLLIPSITKLINLSDFLITRSLSISKLLINISFYLFFLYGILILFFEIYKKCERKKNDISHIFDNIYFPLILSTLIFFFLSPKSAFFITFDTGLYHYPVINHFSEYGIEKGLAEIDFSYGFYNLHFFGQIPFHNIFSTSKYMSPSINIILFGLYIWFFTSEYLDFKKRKDDILFLNIKYENIIITYFIINLIFCSSAIIKNLSSYSPDIAIFITGSICFYIIFSSGILGERKFGFILLYLLTIFSPLIKTSALTICLLNLFYFALFFIRKNSIKFTIKISIIDIKKSISAYINKRKLISNFLIIPLICYLIAIITNIYLSGYIIFPISFTGPIGDWALEPQFTNTIKEIVLNHHRYFGNIPSFESKSNLFIWFPNFLFSKNGLIVVGYWILPNILSSIINLYKSKNYYILFKNKINLSDHIKIISLFALLNIIFLIPVPSYIPWLTPIIIFLTLISILSMQSHIKLLMDLKNSFILFFLTTLIIISFKFSITNKLIANNLFKDTYIYTKFPNLEYKSIQFFPQHWEPILKNKGKSININISKSNQCWNVPAPCASQRFYKYHKNYDKPNL